MERSALKEWLDCNGWDDLTGKKGECYYEESTVLDILEKLVNKKTSNDVSGSLPTKDEVVSEGYRIANDAGYNYRRVLKDPDHDIYYSGWMDCFDWINKDT